jgi:ATP-dependent helicase/nuclease subunit A
VRWLVHHSGLRVVDPVSRAPRPVSYGDIAVLAVATTSLPLLFATFDRDDVPHAARGGSLFLADPLHRQFLLGLCAVADRDDGVAEAALLRPPFFAVDLGDLARGRTDPALDRAAQAREVVRELRRRRFQRSPGATARALLEQTALARIVALGPNGVQRLRGLRELCFQLEHRAIDGALDVVGVMERLRAWLDHPAVLDPPHPVIGDAVRVLTVHQAKGLEFPVVVLWDGRAGWQERTSHDAWTVDRDGRGWRLALDRLRHEEPSGLGLEPRERSMREQERKRVVYVAATRARDLLVIPEVQPRDDRWICGALIGGADLPAVRRLALHQPDEPAPWFEASAPPAEAPATSEPGLTAHVATTWCARARASMRPSLRPRGFAPAGTARLWERTERYGPVFGAAVHAAIGGALRGDAVTGAVAAAARRAGLDVNLDEAVADVCRALEALRALGIVPGMQGVRLEYPLAGVSPEGELVAGYADLVTRVDDALLVLDFKTGQPPEGAPPDEYLAQIEGYRRALVDALRPAYPVRAGLLYTADGGVRWLPSGDNAVA